MQVFITGASGWIGSAAVAECVAHGHRVVGLARSQASEEGLRAAGAHALRGDLGDLAVLRRGAEQSDAVVHLARNHDWSAQDEADRSERAAVSSMLAVVEGTDKPFMIANGLSGLAEGRAALESDPSPAVGPGSDRGGSENLVLEHADRGVRALAIRFAPSVHGIGDWGFLKFLADIARSSGESAYIEEGGETWSAVHRSDAARLIRLGIEAAPAGSRLHAVAEQEVSTREIAEAIGASTGLPVRSVDRAQAATHFGFMAEFFGATMTGSSEATRALTGWDPTGPSLVQDILAGAYAASGTP